MSKNWWFWGFGAYWWGFFHCNPTYDTFLESLGPWECSGGVSSIFGHHLDDQEGPKYPKTDYLEDLGHLDGDFFTIVTPHMIPFWNPWGPWECSGSVSKIFGHYQDDQEGPKCPKTGDLEDLGHLDGNFVIVTPHMRTFLEFLGPWECAGSVSSIFGHQDDQKVQNVQIQMGFGGFGTS